MKLRNYMVTRAMQLWQAAAAYMHNLLPCYTAAAICRCVDMQLAPVLYDYGNFPAQKYATCSPAMRLQQYTGYGNMPTTAIRPHKITLLAGLPAT
jgi:hypothetical protein